MQTPSREYSIQVSDRQLAPIGRALLAVILLALTAWVIYLLRDLLAPVVVSIFLAYLLEPLVDILEDRGVKRVWAILLVLASFVFIFGGALFLFRGEIASELEVLLANVQFDQPELFVEQIREKLKLAFPGMAQSKLIDMMAKAVQRYAGSFLGAGVAGLEGLLSAFGAMVIIPFLVFFILNDARALEKAIVQSIPNRYFEMSLSLFHKADQQLGRYIRGVLLDAAIVGALVVIALTVLDLRYAFFIGLLAGMANLIPYLGPVLAAIPAITVSVVDQGNFLGVPSVLLAFAIVKLIDDVLVQPLVVSRSVELHPVTVIIAIYAGGHVGGILGMIVAVPLVAIAKESFGILHWGFTRYYIFKKPPFADLPVEPMLAAEAKKKLEGAPASDGNTPPVLIKSLPESAAREARAGA